MKRFTFRLEPILRFKQQRERLAELRQKQAALALHTAQAEAAALQEQLRQAALTLQAKLNTGIDTAAWIARHRQAAFLGETLTAAEGKVAEAARALEQATAARRQLATEVEALLSLKEQHWHAHQEEAARTAQQGLDEIGLRRWQAAQEDV